MAGAEDEVVEPVGPGLERVLEVIGQLNEEAFSGQRVAPPASPQKGETDQAVADIDAALAAKEKEIMQV